MAFAVTIFREDFVPELKYLDSDKVFNQLRTLRIYHEYISR